MKFLKSLLNWLGASRSISSIAAPDYVASHGNVARFVFNPRDLNRDGMPRPRVFEPELYLGEYETSVCGLNGTNEARIWFLGRTLRAAENKNAIAALEITTASAREVGLQCKPAPQANYPEHGVIVGWLSGSDDKPKRISAQQEMVAAVLQIRKPPDN